MHEALTRFTFNDPDGNGKQDTWGMSGDVNNWWWASFADVFGAYGVTPFDWQERDGTVVWGGVQPEAREALALLSQWYREGIIHPDFVTDVSRESLHRKFYNGVTGYLYYEGKFQSLDPTSPGSLVNKIKTLNPKADVVCGVLPKGPRGHRGGRVWAGAHVIAFGRHMAERPEAVIRVLEILDTLVTDEQLYLDTHLGKRGVHWDFRDPDVGPASGTERIGEYTDSNAATRELLGSIESGAFFPCSAPLSIIDKYTQREALEFSRTYCSPEFALKDVLGKPDAVPSAGEYLADLRNYQMTTFAEIIRGDKPIEAFDTFVENWNERGGRILTEEARVLLETKKEIYRKVGVTEK
jgi:putative aldouronate transport system substrate-binding protein